MAVCVRTADPSSPNDFDSLRTILARELLYPEALKADDTTAFLRAARSGNLEKVVEFLDTDLDINTANSNGLNALHLASKDGHVEIVTELLKRGAKVDAATKKGNTALHIASLAGQSEIVNILIQYGAAVNIQSQNGFTPLYMAAQENHDQVVKLLLSNGANQSLATEDGFTPLAVAMQQGHDKVVSVLLENDSKGKVRLPALHIAAKKDDCKAADLLLQNDHKPDVTSKSGFTPLHIAAHYGNEEIARLLIKRGADVNYLAKHNISPLHVAAKWGKNNMVKVLLENSAQIDAKTRDGLTPLHCAARSGHEQVVSTLLENSAPISARTKNGLAPLHMASQGDHVDAARVLLYHRAPVDEVTIDYLTSLHVAAHCGHVRVAKLLLDRKADPNARALNGFTPLHIACKKNRIKVVELLLKHGASIESTTESGLTPLHVASFMGCMNIVIFLLQHEANPDVPTVRGETPLHLAARANQTDIIRILLRNGAKVDARAREQQTPLHIASRLGNIDIVMLLLQHGAAVDTATKDMYTALHIAAKEGQEEVAAILVENNASLKAATKNGFTPLHIAAKYGNMNVANILLQKESKLDVQGKNDISPLHLACHYDHPNVANLLLEKGASPHLASQNGHTPLHIAARKNQMDIASTLLENGANANAESKAGFTPLHLSSQKGHYDMTNLLIEHGADPNHKAKDGLTALNIAQKLGYISVMEVLKGLPYDSATPDNKNWEEKYKVIAPESLQETSFMSDSDDEGGSDALISEQPYRYLTADLMKSLRDDSLPIDVTRDDPIHRQVTKEEKQEFTQSNNYCLAENFDSTDGLNLGRLHFRSFLVSFLVDARGGAMKGCRHSGVRIIVPPRRATMPIRVTCRLVKPNKVANPPPLMEGEALATRIIEMGPVGARFLGPVLIDIPHFASIRGKEREIIILRSENGETWKEHDNSVDNDDTLLNTPHDPQMSAMHSGRITRIITTDFPQYFAIITRIKQEVHVIGAEGGILISSVASHVQAVFPAGALTKKIKVGLQAHVIPAELTAKLLGNCVAVSPVITIEPRRRKFHKPITLTIPVPQAANKGMINQYGGETPTLRLLCSIAGGTNEAQWEDVTGSTPLTFMNDRVSFTTTVSARFWLMDCRNIGAVPKMATELYEESLHVPYITNFIIYSKRMDVLEATLRILCMTDGKEGMHTLERQEEFLEIVKSRDVEALDGKDLYIEFSGNLVPVTKSGVQLKFTFKAFRQNRLSFHVKVKDPLLDPVARMLFMREPKVAKGEPPQQPICVLNIVLPEIISKDEIQKKLKGYEDSNIINQKLDYYKSKYKTEQMEKSDKPKETSPEKKFITDTLQKEQTDRTAVLNIIIDNHAAIHESFAQKAACPLESVDASYPNKVGAGLEPDLSPELERQTYSEKRKFWEDISRKRASYQRSESEVSRASQVTINESDSESCQPNVVSEEDATMEGISEVMRSETIEDINVPDISECSVAEKAHYFEEQIQKEIAQKEKGTLKSQQDAGKTDKLFRAKSIEDQKAYVEKGVAEMTKEKIDIEEKHIAEAREIEKILKATEDIKWTKETRKASKDFDKKEKDKDEGKEVREEIQKVITQPMMEICKELLNKERELAEEPQTIRTKTEKAEKEVKDEPTKVIETIEKEERVKQERVEKVVLKSEKSQEETDVIRREAVRDIEETEKMEQIMEIKTISNEAKERKEIDALRSKEIATEHKVEKDIKQKIKDEITRPIKTLEEITTTETTTKEEKITKKPVEEVKSKEYPEEIVTQREPDKSTGVIEGIEEKQQPETSMEVVKEKSSGRRIITEETTIIYKVQKDGTLVQEQIHKSVQIEGASGEPVTQIPEVGAETKIFDKDLTDTVYEVQTTGDVERLRSDIKIDSVPLDVKKEIEQFFEGEKRVIDEEAKVAERKLGIEEKISELPIKEGISELLQKEEITKQIDDAIFDKEKKPVVETDIKLMKKESRIPISAAMAEKDKNQKEVKSKMSPEKLEEKPTKSIIAEKEKDVASPLGKRKEFESRIPKRIMEGATVKEKDIKKDQPGRKDETILITEKKSSEEITSRHEERLTTKSKTQTFSKTFTDAQDAFKMFEDISATDKDFATVTSKVDTKAVSKTEKKEVVSSEISNDAGKFITHEEKERVERKKSSESKLTKESPAETLEEKKSKSEEVDKVAVQKMSMNVTEDKEVIDASASESRVESKKEGLFKSLEDKEGTMTQESGTTRIRESDVDVAIRIKKDDARKVKDTKISPEAATEETDLGKVEMIAQGQSYKESSESFKVEQFIPSRKPHEEEKDKEPPSEEAQESLEKQQELMAKKLEARNIAEDLIQSIESEIERRSSSSGLKPQMLSKEYLDHLMSESSDTDHEKLADDLTKKFEDIMKKSLDGHEIESKIDHPIAEIAASRTFVPEEAFEKGSTRDSISISEDLTKDEESSLHDREESLLSSSHARLQDRDITMSPSSMSDQIDLEGTIDVDTNELEDISKPTSSPPSEKLRSDRSSGHIEPLQKDLYSDTSLSRDKVMSEFSGARVLEVFEPGADSRQDSVDVPSLELDEHKVSETSKDVASLHESAAVDSLEKIAQERDLTVSSSIVSEDVNVDHEQPTVQSRECDVEGARRADSFEIESPPLVSPRTKMVHDLQIKPVNWMIGDEKIEISEMLQPSQVFNQELEEYERRTRISSQDESVDLEQESVTKSSEDISVIESFKEPIVDDVFAPTTIKTKFTVVPVTELDLDRELTENKLDVTCQELVDTLQREHDSKTPTDEYTATIRHSIPREDFDLEASITEAVTEVMPVKEEEVKDLTEDITTKFMEGQPDIRVQDMDKEIPPQGVSVEQVQEILKSMDIGEIPAIKAEDSTQKQPTVESTEKTTEKQEKMQEKPKEIAETQKESTKEESKGTKLDDMLKEWADSYRPKIRSEEYKRHMEKTSDKHDRSSKSTTAPSDTCAFKIKKDDLQSVDLSARYAITVLDQVVKKEIAEVKESLEAAKQDLIEELSENSETVIQIKDSPSEFQFKLQPESIPNDLPFLYRPPSIERVPAEAEPEIETEAPQSDLPIEQQLDEFKLEQHAEDIPIEEKSIVVMDEPVTIETPEIDIEKRDETLIAVQDEQRDDEEDDHPSPLPASISGSDIDNRDDSYSLAPPHPAPRRRQKPARISKRVKTSESEAGSSSGESSNYQSCDYEVGSGSRPSSSDIEALQSAGVQSGTVSEYETAMMSIEHSASRPTSQDYQTAVSTLSSRESMKSLNSLSSGHLGSIDSTSELSETLVPSDVEADKDEIDENLDSALDAEQEAEASDSSGSDIPMDEAMDKIDSHIPCRMKRSSEMIFQQIMDDSVSMGTESMDEAMDEDAKVADSATSAFMEAPGALQSVDIMTSRVSEDGVQSVCTQVISTRVTRPSDSDELEEEAEISKEEIDTEKDTGTLDTETAESSEQRSGVEEEGFEPTAQTSVHSMMQQASMSLSSASGMSFDTVIEKDKSERHSPDSDSFELVDKPDIIDDFVVIEEVGREAEEFDSEGKSIRISSIPQVTGKNYDRDLENLITENKEDSQVSTSQASKTNDLFEFESEESPPQASNDDQYSQSYSDEEQYENKKWIEMQFHADTRAYDIEYDRGPLEDIKEEEVTDFEAGSSRFGSLGSHKESIGSVGSMRGSFGSTPEYDILAGKKYFSKPADHDTASLTSLQEFEHLESTVASENSRKLQCGSQDSINNGSLPKRYVTSRSGHGDDISLSSLKDFEGLEKACREAHLIELRAREEEDLLEHESPENKYKMESLPRSRAETSAAGSFNPSTSGSDDYEKRIKEIDEIIRIAQSNVEKLDRQDDTTEDISQIEITDVEKVVVQPIAQTLLEELKPEEEAQVQRESNIMETSTDSLELEDNVEKKYHPLCRSSDSLEMKTTLDFPSLSSDSLNNVRDARETPLDTAGNQFGGSARRISSDSLDMPLLEQQDIGISRRSSDGNGQRADEAAVDSSAGQTPSTEIHTRNGKTRTSPSSGT